MTTARPRADDRGPPARMNATSADAPTRLAISNHALRLSGGIERYALTLVRGLHERGVRPWLIAKAFDRQLPEYGWVEPVHAGVSGVPGKLRDLFFDWRIGRAKRRLDLFPLIGCNQTRWSDIAICGSTHPGYLEAMGERAGGVDRMKIALERAHLANAAIVVAHSARMKAEAVRHHDIDPAKITLLYPPVDGARFSPVDEPARAALRQRLGLPADRAVFLLASTGHRRKGLDQAAAFFAATALPATLVVAGRPMQRSVPNVAFLGYRHDMEDVYRAVDFTVLASLYEPFGLVSVESVLSGTPVLVAEGAGCAEVIREPALLPFSLTEPASLGAAVAAATERWRQDRHRLERPASLLAYDPGVAPHVDALLALVRSLIEAHGSRGT